MRAISDRAPVLRRACAAAGAVLACLAVTPAAAGQQAAEVPAITVIGNSLNAPHVFGTTAIPIKASRFSTEWTRARQDATSHPALHALVAPARGLSRERQIALVQGAVHRRIQWRSDATEWGVHDYWASASQTLERGFGDMEDRAIVKMQALRLLGFADRDLFLTLGRDKVGGPISVLIVRSEGRYFVLDDLGGTPKTADRREGFTPMLTFAGNSAWAHAIRIAKRAPSSTASAAK